MFAQVTLIVRYVTTQDQWLVGWLVWLRVCSCWQWRVASKHSLQI